MYQCIWYKNKDSSRLVVAQAFNPSTWEAEAGRFLSLSPAWSTEWVPGKPGLHRETLSSKKKPKQRNKETKIKNSKHILKPLWVKYINSFLVIK